MNSISQLTSALQAEPLNDDDMLWRYVPLRTALTYLMGSIFIPSVSLLRKTDPLEGRFHFNTPQFNGAFQDYFATRTGDVERWIYDELCTPQDKRSIEINPTYPNHSRNIIKNCYFNYLTDTRFAWCWFRSFTESALMWYSYGHQGVAIASSVGQLRKMLLTTNRDFLYGRMHYVKFKSGEIAPAHSSTTGLRSDLLMRPHFLKRDEYVGEQEVRFVTTGPKKWDMGITLKKIDPQDWIAKIRLWPGLKSVEVSALQHIINEITPKIECRCSDLFGAEPTSDEGFVSSVNDSLEELWLNEWQNKNNDIPIEVRSP